MRFFYQLIFCSCAIFSLVAEDISFISEEAQITLLINATKKSLESLQKLEKSLAAFREQENKCLEQPENTEALYKLSECALALFTNIRENRVEPYFHTFFIDELEQLKKTAEYKNLPPIVLNETTSSCH